MNIKSVCDSVANLWSIHTWIYKIFIRWLFIFYMLLFLLLIPLRWFAENLVKFYLSIIKGCDTLISVRLTVSLEYYKIKHKSFKQQKKWPTLLSLCFLKHHSMFMIIACLRKILMITIFLFIYSRKHVLLQYFHHVTLPFHRQIQSQV